MASSSSAEPAWFSRNRGSIIAACAAVAGGYAIYKTYHSNSLSSTQQMLRKLTETAQKYSEACSSAGDALALLAGDLQGFLASDDDAIPQSFRQLAKLAQCEEVQASLRTCVASAVSGASVAPQAGDGPSVVDKVIEAFLSDRGHSLVGLAISVAARNSTAAMCEQVRAALAERSAQAETAAAQRRAAAAAAGSGEAEAAADGSAALMRVLSLLSSEQGERLLRLLISSSVSSMVGSYVESTSNVDVYAPMLEALARPGNTAALTELLSGVAATFTHELVGSVAAVLTASQQQQQQQQAWRQQGEQEVECSRIEELGVSSVQRGVQGCADNSPCSEPDTPTSTSAHSGPQTPEPSVAGHPVSPPWLVHSLLRRRGGGSTVAGGDSLALRPTAGASGSSTVPQLQALPSLVGGAGGSTGSALSMASGVVVLLSQAAGSEGIRRLVVDVTSSSTREFVRALVHPAGSGGGPQADGELVYAGAVRALLYRVHVMLSVVLFMGVYALSPQMRA